MGQKLLDLDTAYKQGTIGKAEYDEAKQEILNRYDK